MDNVNHLLEGASPYQVLQDQAGKLAGKWEKSGLLEGIESSTESNNMAMLLENQAKQLVNEASSTGTGTSITTGNSEVKLKRENQLPTSSPWLEISDSLYEQWQARIAHLKRTARS